MQQNERTVRRSARSLSGTSVVRFAIAIIIIAEAVHVPACHRDRPGLRVLVVVAEPRTSLLPPPLRSCAAGAAAAHGGRDAAAIDHPHKAVPVSGRPASAC